MLFVFVGIGLSVSLIAWRLRHQEPVAWQSAPWILLWVGVNTAVVVAGRVIAMASPGYVPALSAASLLVTLPGLLVGVQPNPAGKKRLHMGGNAFTKKVDTLVFHRNAAMLASRRSRDIDLLMNRSTEHAKLAHVTLDEYAVYLQTIGAPLVQVQQVRNWAKAKMDTRDKLDTALSDICRRGHWPFYRQQFVLAEQARRSNQTTSRG